MSDQSTPTFHASFQRRFRSSHRHLLVTTPMEVQVGPSQLATSLSQARLCESSLKPAWAIFTAATCFFPDINCISHVVYGKCSDSETHISSMSSEMPHRRFRDADSVWHATNRSGLIVIGSWGCLVELVNSLVGFSFASHTFRKNPQRRNWLDLGLISLYPGGFSELSSLASNIYRMSHSARGRTHAGPNRHASTQTSLNTSTKPCYRPFLGLPHTLSESVPWRGWRLTCISIYFNCGNIHLAFLRILSGGTLVAVLLRLRFLVFLPSWVFFCYHGYWWLIVVSACVVLRNSFSVLA